MKRQGYLGHIAAFFTIMIWGTTFISTKVLLVECSPIEILFLRFMIGYLVLWLVYPRRLKIVERRQEYYFAGAGLCGITLYYLFENIALTYTTASNVGVIISIAPFFTVIFACLFLHEKRPTIRFFIGFVIAMIGIYMLSFDQNTKLALNLKGDLLAVIAAIIWAAYSTLVKKISSFNFPIIPATRRTFFYGLLFMIPTLSMFDVNLSLDMFTNPTILWNLIFLGVGASAVCFVTWSRAVALLGSTKTSVYIYMVPLITTITSSIILHEEITQAILYGIMLTLLGLFLSEYRSKKEN